MIVIIDNISSNKKTIFSVISSTLAFRDDFNFSYVLLKNGVTPIILISKINTLYLVKNQVILKPGLLYLLFKNIALTKFRAVIASGDLKKTQPIITTINTYICFKVDTKILSSLSMFNFNIFSSILNKACHIPQKTKVKPEPCHMPVSKKTIKILNNY